MDTTKVLTGPLAEVITPVKLAFVTGTPEKGDAVTAVGNPNIAGAFVNMIFLASDHVKVKVIPDACTFMLGRASPPPGLGNRNAVCKSAATSVGLLPSGTETVVVKAGLEVSSVSVIVEDAGVRTAPLATALTGFTLTDIGCPLSGPAVLNTIGRPVASDMVPVCPVPPAFPLWTVGFQSRTTPAASAAGPLAPPGQTVSITPLIRRTDFTEPVQSTFVVPPASLKQRTATTRSPATGSDKVPFASTHCGVATEQLEKLSLIVMK